jgi:hypothetical protein
MLELNLTSGICGKSKGRSDREQIDMLKQKDTTV